MMEGLAHVVSDTSADGCIRSVLATLQQSTRLIKTLKAGTLNDSSLDSILHTVRLMDRPRRLTHPPIQEPRGHVLQRALLLHPEHATVAA